MEIKDLSWNETTTKRFNNPLLPKSIRGLIIGKSGCGKTTLLLNLLLRPGWLDYDNLCVFGKSLFQPEYKILKKVFEENLPKDYSLGLFNMREIPEGSYEIDDINNAVQWEMKKRGHYDSINEDYYITISANSNTLKSVLILEKDYQVDFNQHNTKVEGGFLGLLAGLAARALPMLAKTVLPALGVGALSGLASTGVQKAIGSGLYLNKGGIVSEVDTVGDGLYLKPYKGKGLKSYGDGLYLKRGGKFYDGKGLL